jgi:type IV secretion system protein VirD4
MSASNTRIGPQVWERSSPRLNPLAVSLALSVLLGCVAATECAAYCYGFSPELGANLSGIYPPWMAFVWCAWWYPWNPEVFQGSGLIGLFTAVGTFAWSAIRRWEKSPSSPYRFLHGSARWATRREVKRMGMFADAGVCVGGWAQGKQAIPLYHDGPEHVALIAPSGSGKGVSIIVPTLLKWPHSVVVTDMKGELAALTAPCRKELLKNRVLCFEPAAPSGSCGFNALQEVRFNTDYEVGDCQNLATLLMDPEGKGLRSSPNESHWNVTAADLLTGCILHHAYEATRRKEVPSLPALSCMLSDPDEPVARLLDVMAANRRMPEYARKAAAMAAEEQRSRPDKEAGSVLSYARKALNLYRDPIVARNVSRSEFKISDLMHADEPVSLYIIVQPADQERMVPLICILLSLIARRLAVKPGFEKGEPKPVYKHRLLMALDEFPAWGNLGVIAKSLAYFRGYGVRVLLAVQDLAQLRERYGDNESITSNCGIQIAFAPSKVETAEYLSKLLGTATVVKRQTQVSRGGKGSGNVSESVQEVARTLLTPDECTRIPGPVKVGDRITAAGDLIVCMAGKNPIYGRQVPYFMNDELKQRAALEMTPDES